MWLMLALQHVGLVGIRAQVEAGARLFTVWHGEDDDRKMVGALVLRVDESIEGAEGVIVAAGGRLPGFDFTVDLLPHIETLFRGVRCIRIHTARPGMAAKLAAMGYAPREMVFAKGVNNDK